MTDNINLDEKELEQYIWNNLSIKLIESDKINNTENYQYYLTVVEKVKRILKTKYNLL